MRYAILSDLHSNEEALQAVLEHSRRQGVQQYYCCGDIVGYGAGPHAAVHWARSRKIPCVVGNHDWGVAGRLDVSYFIPEGKEAINWTRQQLNIDDIQWLGDLPLTLKTKDFILVHGTLNHPEAFNYLDDIDKAPDTFFLMDRPVCFLGHRHRPEIFIERGHRIYYPPALSVELTRDQRYIVDVGSVGQPRDGNPLASYATYDTETALIEIHRVPYDMAEARRKIIKAGLPAVLGDHLLIGR
jgi:diadenosine tetraphosphatase ApaH/serine/threonine PP2A family protein phosphatase